MLGKRAYNHGITSKIPYFVASSDEEAHYLPGKISI